MWGGQACAGCHSAQFHAWKGSHHGLAMQPAAAATVLGNFSGAQLEHFGVTTTFFRDSDKFMVRTDGPDGALHEYPIAYTFGVYPLQQYLIANHDRGQLRQFRECGHFEQLEHAGGQAIARDGPRASVSRGTEGLQTHRWREADSNSWSRFEKTPSKMCQKVRCPSAIESDTTRRGIKS